MNITQKLQLSARNNYLTLIRQGIFARCYNESAYIITELLGYSLKLSCNVIPQMNGKIVISCGFPFYVVKERFTHAIATDFGYEVCAEYDLTHYSQWFKRTFAQLQQQAAFAQPSRAGAAKVASVRACQEKNIDVELTPQQFAFLQSWEKNKYPTTVEQGFIESLKATLTKTK